MRTGPHELVGTGRLGRADADQFVKEQSTHGALLQAVFGPSQAVLDARARADAERCTQGA